MSERLTFPKKIRLLTSAEFQQLQFNVKKRVTDSFLLLVRCCDREYPRLGITVPKRHVKNAVDRNRIKRIVRESFRHFQHKLMGFDIIFISRKHINTLDKKELRQKLDDQWEQLIKQ